MSKNTFFDLVTLTFDLDLSKTIPNCTCPRSTHIPNLVNLGQRRLELSRGQKCYRRTDGRTYRRTDGRTDGRTRVTTIPFRPKGRRVKMTPRLIMQVGPKSPKFRLIFVFCPNDIEDESQGHPFSIAIERFLIYIFCANLVKIYPLHFFSCGQAQNGKKNPHF